MVQNALAASLLIFAIVAGVLLREVSFLVPYRKVIWEQYGESIVYFSVIFLSNLFAASYTLLRGLSLKDTGDKLAHLEKQLRGRQTISEELTERILEGK